MLRCICPVLAQTGGSHFDLRRSLLGRSGHGPMGDEVGKTSLAAFAAESDHRSAFDLMPVEGRVYFTRTAPRYRAPPRLVLDLPISHHLKIHSADQLGPVCLGGFHVGHSLLQSARV